MEQNFFSSGRRTTMLGGGEGGEDGSSEFNSYLSFNRFRFALSWYLSESFLSFVILLWPF